MAKVLLMETTEASRMLAFKQGISGSENPDSLIARKGMGYIEDIERDSHYSSCLNTRIQDVVGKKWGIKPYHDKSKKEISPRDIEIADFVRDQLENIPTFETDIISMFDSISKGFSLSEINYKGITSGKWKGKIGLKNIRKKDAGLFSFKFDKYGYFVPVQINPRRKELPLTKFVHFINGRDDENPWGESVGSKVAFWVWLKKNGAKFWAIYLERYGMPLSVVDIPDNLNPDTPEYKKAETVLNAMLKESGIIKPKSFDIKYLEALRGGSANYDGFIKRCNAEISKLVLGNTLATDEGVKGSGTHAQASIHAGVLKNYTLFDVIISSAAINYQIVRRLVDINFVTEHYPVFEWKSFDIAMLTVLAQNIKNLIDAGLKVSAKFIYQAIGIDMPEGLEEVLEPVSPPQAPNNGIDNKAIQHHFEENAIPKQISALKDVEEQNKKFIVENDKIVDAYTKILNEQFKKIGEKIAKKKTTSPDDVHSIVKNSINRQMKEFLILGYLQGKKHAMMQTNLNFEEGKEYYPYKELIKRYYELNVITKAEFKLLEKEMQRKAFTIAEIASEDILKAIKAELGNTIDTGGSWRKLNTKINAILEKEGYTGLRYDRLEVIVRNNLQEQYSEAQEDLYNSMDKEEYPTKTVLPIRDSSTRKSHLDLYGFTRPVDDPIWQKLKTPFSHNCRCTIVLNHKDRKISITEKDPDLSVKGFEFIN